MALTHNQKKADRLARELQRETKRARAAAAKAVSDAKWDRDLRLPDGSADGELVVFDATSDNGDTVAIIDPYQIYDGATADAFADLIKAAPAMLAALENLLAYANGYSEKLRRIGRGAEELGPDADSASVAGMARAAILAAKGGN